MSDIQKLFEEMCQVQNELNTYVAKNSKQCCTSLPWTMHDWSFHTAVMGECYELMEMLGFKWWKAAPQTSRYQQVLELVDIWHFLLSATLRAEDGVPAPITLFADRPKVTEDSLDRAHHLLRQLASLPIDTKGVAGSTIRTHAYVVFAELCQVFEVSFEELYRMYMRKAVLNLFRWSNGYSEGTYVKEWFGKEDNEVLEDLLINNPEATKQQMEQMLSLEYFKVIREADWS
jgi:dimeric dUTPase (all-alpha-NTP-PPase superfamily)